MQFLVVKKWCIVNVFSDTKQNMFAVKFSEKFSAVLPKHIILNVKWV